MATPLFPIVQRYTDYILVGATWTASVAASASYNVTDLQFLNPAKRILWSVKTVTITATLGGAVLGDIFALPFSNLDPAVLSITNNGSSGGINQAVTVPAASPGGWPNTAWIDLTNPALNGGLGWSTGQRTASVWNFVITSNTNNVLLGAAIWVSGPKRTLARNLVTVSAIPSGASASAAKTTTEYFRSITTNSYGVDLVYDYGTMKRELVGDYIAISSTEQNVFTNWLDGSRGGNLPSLFVRDATINDAILGYANARVLTDWIQYPNSAKYSLTMTELSKGTHL